MTRYAEAFDYLTDVARPRRKYDPKHWLVGWYWAGVRIAIMMRRNPFVVLWRGITDGWRDA